MAYDAFISYSHAADGRLAAAVQRGLQQLARPWWKPRALRVFRDTTGLSVSPHLWAGIAAALDESEWFVLLASPEAAQSEWVNREIDHWCASKPIDRILPVVTGGEWQWDRDRATFTDDSTAVPDSLRRRFVDEPRHLDLAWAQSEQALNVRSGRFRDAIAELAAPVHHVAKDELEGEDLKQHRRAIRLARGATTVLVLLLVVSIVSGFIALQQRSTARRAATAARRAATSASAQKLAAQAINAAHDSRNDLALLLAVEANRLDPSAATRASLLSALVDQPTLRRELHGLDDVTSVAFSPDSSVVAGGSSTGKVMLWDVDTGRPVAHEPAQPAPLKIFGPVFAGPRTLVGVSSAQGYAGAPPQFVYAWNVGDGRVVRRVPVPAGTFLAATASDAPVAVLAHSGTAAVSILDARTGRIQPLPAAGAFGSFWGVSPDGGAVAAVSDSAQPGQPTDFVIQAWRSAGDQPIGRSCQGQVPADTTGAAFYPSAQEVSLDAAPTTVRVVEPSGTGRVVITCDIASGNLTSVTLSLSGGEIVTGESPDGRTLVSRDADGTFRIYAGENHTQLGSPLHAPLIPSGMSTVAGTVVFAPDGHLFTATEGDDVARIWDTRAIAPIAHPAPVPAIDARYESVELDANGRIGLGQTPFGPTGTSRLDVIDMRRNRILTSFANTTGGSLSDDGTLVVAADRSRLIVYDVPHDTTRTLPLRRLACAQASTFAASPRSPTVIVACRNADPSGRGPQGLLQRVDIVGTHLQIHPPIAAAVWPDVLRFSPDGRVIAAQTTTVTDSSLQLFDTSRGRLRAGLTIPNAGSFAFTADSKSVVTNRGHLASWAVTGSAHPTDLSGATPGATLNASPDGNLLAADSPGAIALWDLRSDTELGVLPTGNIDNGYSTLQFARDGKTLTVLTVPTPSAVPSGRPVSRTAVTWDLDPAAWERTACAIANRNLTRAEWVRYIGDVPYRETCPK